MRVIGTEQAAACSDNPDQFAGSDVSGFGGEGVVEPLLRNTASLTRADGASCLEKRFRKASVELLSLFEGLSKAQTHPSWAPFLKIWILITIIKTACGVSVNSILICNFSGG